MTKDQIKDGDYCKYKGIDCTFTKTPTGFDLQPLDASQDIGHGMGIRHTIADEDWNEIADMKARK